MGPKGPIALLPWIVLVGLILGSKQVGPFRIAEVHILQQVNRLFLLGLTAFLFVGFEHTVSKVKEDVFISSQANGCTGVRLSTQL